MVCVVALRRCRGWGGGRHCHRRRCLHRRRTSSSWSSSLSVASSLPCHCCAHRRVVVVAVIVVVVGVVHIVVVAAAAIFVVVSLRLLLLLLLALQFMFLLFRHCRCCHQCGCCRYISTPSNPPHIGYPIVLVLPVARLFCFAVMHSVPKRPLNDSRRLFHLHMLSCLHR